MDSEKMSQKMSGLSHAMQRLLHPEIDEALVRINADFVGRHPEKTEYILGQMFEFGYRSGMEATGQFIRLLERQAVPE
jgi:hypothetical protein